MTEVKVRLNKDGAFPVNDKLAGLVPMATEAEQAALTADIKDNHQRDPIVLWRGEVVDGRCRQKALVILGEHILYRELDDSLTEDEVRVFVKSVNIRRNLTPTQKVMSACRESLREGETRAVAIIAKTWGISRDILGNARFITKENPDMAETLFNGGSVEVIDANGRAKLTNKVTTIYAYLKKLSEAVEEDNQHAWQEDTYIKTQAGKEWYYTQVSSLDSQTDILRVKMLLAELANYKFSTGETDD